MMGGWPLVLFRREAPAWNPIDEFDELSARGRGSLRQRRCAAGSSCEASCGRFDVGFKLEFDGLAQRDLSLRIACTDGRDVKEHIRSDIGTNEAESFVRKVFDYGPVSHKRS